METDKSWHSMVVLELQRLNNSINRLSDKLDKNRDDINNDIRVVDGRIDEVVCKYDLKFEKMDEENDSIRTDIGIFNSKWTLLVTLLSASVSIIVVVIEVIPSVLDWIKK